MAHAENYPTLSDGLAAVIAAIEPTRNTGLVMTRPNVATFLDSLHALLDQARHLETIADRAQWNEKARRDAQHAHRAGLEAGLASGTVELLPVIPRRAAAHQGEGGVA